MNHIVKSNIIFTIAFFVAWKIICNRTFSKTHVIFGSLKKEERIIGTKGTCIRTRLCTKMWCIIWK